MKDSLENEITPAPPQSSTFDPNSPDAFFPPMGTASSAGPVNIQALGGGNAASNPMAGILAAGNVVRVEVRDQAGAPQPMTRDYPVSPDGTIHLPMAGNITAAGKTPTQLNADIRAALITGGFFQAPVVNVSLLPSKTVDYTHAVRPGEPLYVRVLGSDGGVQFDGIFPVDSNGVVHLPMAGDVNVLGQTYGVIESRIRSLLITGQFLSNPIVHVADTAL